MKFDSYTYTISAHLLSAIINGDETGLDDDESDSLSDFLANLPAPNGHWDCDDADYSDFGRCEVMGLMSDVVVCRYMVPIGG